MADGEDMDELDGEMFEDDEDDDDDDDSGWSVSDRDVM